MARYLSTEAGDHLVTEGSDSLILERLYAAYEGYELFDIRKNWAEDPSDRLERSMVILDNVTGRPLTRAHSDTPIGSFDVLFTLEGRSEIAEFRSWLKLMKGRQVPIWVPTWNSDLKPTADLSGTSLTIESVGFAGSMFPHNARKHLAIIDHTGLIYPRGISAANDNGTTESLTLASSLGTTLTKEHTMVSFLILARPYSDTVRLVWITHALVEVRMTFTEVPREAPAP